MRWRIALVVALLLPAFGPAALAQYGGRPAAPPLKKFTVLLPFRVGITFFPLSVARGSGSVGEEAFDWNFRGVNGSSALGQQLAAGNARRGVILAPNPLPGFAEGVRYKAFYD